MADGIKDCCKDPKNLVVKESFTRPGYSEVMKVCQVCGCRHFEGVAEPFEVGLKGA